MVKLTFIVLTALISIQQPADMERCSVGILRENPEGYHWPLEHIRRFVQEADVIVRAVADSVGGSRTGEPPAGIDSVPPNFPRVVMSEIVFRPVEILRGTLPENRLVLGGTIVDRDDFNRGAVPYRMVRPSGQRGSCDTREYRIGAEYLFLLAHRNGELTPHWAPLAPLNEQIRGAEDPWVAWVRAELGR